jgi:integrase
MHIQTAPRLLRQLYPHSLDCISQPCKLCEPYKTMVIVAMCTGLRVSEILALRWEHIDFKARVMLVQQGVVNGRIGRVKTETSQDEVPLDPAFVDVLRKLKGDQRAGLVFRSPVTGGCYYSGIIQRQVLKPKGRKSASLAWDGTPSDTPIARSWTRQALRLVYSRSSCGTATSLPR